MGNWARLFDPDGLTAHGFCLSWEPGLIALHAVSDAVIGLSYLSIPLALASLTRQRRDLQYSWVLYAFVGFIVACGVTHLFSILTLWVPAYTAEGLAKAVAAVLSVATAILLWPLVPRLVALPSPAQLRQANLSLSSTIAERERTLEQLRLSEARVLASNTELERRVAERTAELEARNLELAAALLDRTNALTQRDLLLREVYHRVKNNLQIVDGMITLQALKLTDPAAKEALLGLRGRIYALGLVHQQLMSSSDLRTFDLVSFLRELSNNLSEGWGEDGANIVVNAVAMQVGLDYAVPFGLLVTELVTNSLKHAVPPHGTGEVRVGLSLAEDGQVVLTVSDDGTGREDIAAEASATGPGSGLVKGLVSQLGGTMSVRSYRGRITEIRTPLPLHE